MLVYLGTINCDPLTLDKRSTFVTGDPVQVQIFEPCNIETPTLILNPFQGWNTDCNYMYIPEWQSYYFLDNPDVIDGKRIKLHGAIDYLTSYADDIKQLSGYLVRTADTAHRNKYIHDSIRQVQANRYMHIYQFDKSPFTANYSTDITYLLTVVGGAHSGQQRTTAEGVVANNGNR